MRVDSYLVLQVLELVKLLVEVIVKLFLNLTYLMSN
nr:MAG TPA: hypothetical protein [Caudoviricetes sp.]